MQTAHTGRAGQVSVRAGIASVFNRVDGRAGHDRMTSTTAEPGVRVSLADQLDAGLAPWFGLGGAVDAKLNLVDNRARAAFGPRISAGWAYADPSSVIGLEAGVIGSYRLWSFAEPYAGLSFANHWFLARQTTTPVELGSRQQLAARRGYGDGLVKTAIGVELRVSPRLRALLEYDHWFPAQNDPGDGYAFLANDVVSCSFAYHVSAD